MPGIGGLVGGVVSSVGRQLLANHLEKKARPLVERVVDGLENLGKAGFDAGKRFASDRISNTKALIEEIKEFKQSMHDYEEHLAGSHPVSAGKEMQAMRQWLGEFIENHKNVTTSVIGNVYQEMIQFRRVLSDHFDKSEPEIYKPRKMSGKQLQELDQARETAETIKTHLSDSSMPLHFKLMLASKMHERLIDQIALQPIKNTG